GKMPSPTSNDREAFCCRFCYEQHYRTRCRVCERPIDPRGGRKICKLPKCRRLWAHKAGFDRYSGISGVTSIEKHPGHRAVGKVVSQVPAAQGLVCGSSKTDRARWRKIGGPSLSRDSFHAAIVPDGPNLTWAGGSYERTESANREILRKHA